MNFALATNVPIEHNTSVTHDLTTFLDESRALPETAVPGQKPNPSSLFLTANPEQTKYLSSILSKSTLIYSGTWDATFVRNSILHTINMPKDITFNPIRMILDNYSFLSGDLVIRIQFNGTPFHQGRLIAFWSPVYGVQATVVRASQLPNVELDASTNMVQELRIPYSHLVTCLDTYDNTVLGLIGKFQIMVLNTLRFAVGSSPTLNYYVYMHFENAHVYNPTAEHAGFQAQAGDLSGSSHTSQHLASNARTIQDTTHGVGEVSSVTLDLKQGIQCDMPPKYFPTNEDEMHLKTILAKPSLFRFLNWTTAEVARTQIDTLNINPHTFRDVQGTATHPSPLTYFSWMYERWNGDIEITIDFICTQFHRGQIGVTFVPQYGGGIDDSYLFSNPGFILDLKTSHTFKIRIPYTANTPWRVVPRADWDDVYHPDSSTGRLVFFVLNELTVGSGLPNDIDINLKVNAASNFNLSFPRTSPKYTLIAPANLIAEGDFEGDSSTSGIELATELPRSKEMKAVSYTRETNVEENYHMDLKKILSRPIQFVGANPGIADFNWKSLCRIACSPSMTWDEANLGSILDQMSYISNTFFFFRGNMRILFATTNAANNPNLAIASIRFPRTVETQSYNAYSSLPHWDNFQHISNLAIKPIQQYDIPYINMHSSVFTSRNTSEPISVNPFYVNIATLDINLRIQENSNFAYSLFRSLGETARLFYFVGCPTMENIVS
jgi:hypothetical protein